MNQNLPQCQADFSTLAAGLDYAAQGVTGMNFYSGRGALEHVMPYADLRRRALVVARKLLSTGLKRLERVAIVAETGPEFIITFFACQYAGLVPCPVPYSMYIGGREAYEQRIAGMLKAADAHAVVAPSDQVESLRAAAAMAGVTQVFTHEDIAAQPEAMSKLQGFGAEDVAYIQYSSGSTSAPKGVLISQRAITTNARGMVVFGLKTKPTDRGFSWLPLYHDMGLVGFCLGPMLSQCSIDYLATTAFARRPSLWLKLMSENRSTISFAPTFGYDLAAKRIGSEVSKLDLSAWRAAGIGGDMVRADVLAEFARALEPAKFNGNVFLPSYGMAESTLALSFPPTGRAIRVDYIDKNILRHESRAVPAEQGAADTRGYVACGRILPGHQMEVRDAAGQVLAERLVGRIFVKGPSLMSGYFHNVEATAEVIDDQGFLNTGDMGYLIDGEIVITGRAKDLILHNGRNIWPQDIEWAAERYAELNSGDVAAFAVEGDDGDDEVVVLVECRNSDTAEQEKLRHEVAKLVHQGSGVDCKIELVAPRSLPFTSSGKLSRAGARAKYLAGEITIVAPHIA
ncbi:fatty acyl-AMP ligase [Aestuariivirga litoralis]|uniref:fatty acyl-AMP ligase n=1 Tax=Aestuariivirga litoralis TaxID=2650924 RepID=UPI0018C6F42E